MSVSPLSFWTLMLWQLPLFNAWVTGWLCACPVGVESRTVGKEWTSAFFFSSLCGRAGVRLWAEARRQTPARLRKHFHVYRGYISSCDAPEDPDRWTPAISMAWPRLNSQGRVTVSCLFRQSSSPVVTVCELPFPSIAAPCEASSRRPRGNVKRSRGSNIACHHGERQVMTLKWLDKWVHLANNRFSRPSLTPFHLSLRLRLWSVASL